MFRDHELVATHARLARPGQRSTVDDHMPPEALAYKLQDPQWCLKQAEDIGTARLEAACHRALTFDDPKYRTVKIILEKGLDQLAGEEPLFDVLAESYTGQGRFCRDTDKLLTH